MREPRVSCGRAGALAVLVAGLLAAPAALAAGPDAARSEAARPVRILFGGDTYMGETYRSGRKALADHGYRRAFEGLAPFLAAADHAVLNLEGPLTTRTTSPLAGLKRWVHAGHPVKTPEVLRAHRVDAVSLANNHGMDHGAAGLVDTLDALRAAGPVPFGAGASEADAARPFTLDLGGRRLHVLGAFQHSSYHRETLGFYAGPGRPGVQGWTDAGARAQVAALRRQDPRAWIVAFPHWGVNYRWRSPKQARLARALVEAGADLVLGHGAHLLQEVHRIDGRWVVYSLGNFVFLTSGRFAEADPPPFGLVAMLELDAQGPAQVKLYPIRSDNLRTRYRPAPVDQAQLASIHAQLVERGLTGAAAGVDDLGPYLQLDLGPTPGLDPARRPAPGPGP